MNFLYDNDREILIVNFKVRNTKLFNSLLFGTCENLVICIYFLFVFCRQIYMYTRKPEANRCQFESEERHCFFSDMHLRIIQANLTQMIYLQPAQAEVIK